MQGLTFLLLCFHLRPLFPSVHNSYQTRKLIDEASASSSSDIWALGLIFWHLFTGRPLMSYFGTSSWVGPPHNGQKKFLLLKREERRNQITNFLAKRFGQAAVVDEEYTGAIMEVLLDTFEPNSSDRPTAKDFLSYHLFSLIEDERDEPDDDTQATLGSRKGLPAAGADAPSAADPASSHYQRPSSGPHTPDVAPSQPAGALEMSLDVAELTSGRVTTGAEAF
ncbi:hypothetical protein B0T24DRAFT_596592 [Lasiosphaeria ovina]|uniref:Protein kinase domain-containing protein n=1 Tax=Lasiosphaeria ovina TaxID=92902 RepID=A0AAE0JZ50_9PEZI|nr:hypothetical protein B0T24DRAFT_596592 [Lasiosphaeria ovina]